MQRHGGQERGKNVAWLRAAAKIERWGVVWDLASNQKGVGHFRAQRFYPSSMSFRRVSDTFFVWRVKKK